MTELQPAPSRRHFFQAVSGAIVGAGALTAIDAEAELLSLGCALKAAWRAQMSANDADYDAACEKCLDVVQKIAATPARSLDGLRVKAMAASWSHDGLWAGVGDGATDGLLASGVIADLIAIARA